jgi:hypothetical protein
MSAKSAIALVVAAFVLTLIVRLPATLLSPLLPASVQCQAADGTLWRGSCAELRTANITLSDVHWTLHPLSLLRARLALDVQSGDTRASGSARLVMHLNGDLEVEELKAMLPVQGGLTPLPAGWSGDLALAIDSASVHDRHLVAVQGTVIARGLRSERPATDLGSIELEFPPPPPPPAPMIGTVRDLGGPLSIRAQLKLARDGSYELDGTVAPHNAADPQLQQMLQLLGPADASGGHEISMAGTL